MISNLPKNAKIEHKISKIGTQYILGKSIDVYVATSTDGSDCHACGAALSFFEIVREIDGYSFGSIRVGMGIYGSWGSAPRTDKPCLDWP